MTDDKPALDPPRYAPQDGPAPESTVQTPTDFNIHPDPGFPRSLAFMTRVDEMARPKVWQYQGQPVYQVPTKYPAGVEAWRAYLTNRVNMLIGEDGLRVGMEVLVLSEGGTAVRTTVRHLGQYNLAQWPNP
jgi:hypothetical protein